MTGRNAVSQVRSMFDIISSEDIITDRAIFNELKDTTYKLIRQQTNKRKLFASPNIFVTLPCLQMINVPLSECCSYKSPCTISRSQYKIPRISEGIYGLLVQGVYSLDKRNKYKESTPTRYSNYLDLKLTKSQRFFWVQDDYLYVSDPEIETVTISAYFEEDVDIVLYSCDTNKQDCPVNPLDLEFRCPSFLLKDIKDLVYRGILDTYERSIAKTTQ